jgi:phage pi2 protein 07
MVELGDHLEVNEENYVPVPEDKLKEDQKKEYEELVEKSYSVTRSGDVIKKFNLPSFQPLSETQRENKMMDAVGQAVAQAFVKSATVMGNTVYNTVVKTFAEGMFSGCMGPCYIQPNQMQYVPLEVSMAAACRLKIAKQKQVTVKRHHMLLLQRRWLQQLLFTQLLRLLLHLCKMGLHLGFQRGGILLLGMLCIQISLPHHPRHSLMHRLLSR